MDFEDNNPFSVIEDEAIGVPQDKPPARNDPTRTDERHTPQDLGEISIVDAGKCREGAKRGHITYTIKVGSTNVRRRYSEFESLRRTLRRMYPTTIVPSIPEKHSLTAYAVSPAHAHEDARTIEHRRRMLSVFLNRCAAIPAIRNSVLFERFLDPNASWSEVLTLEPVASVPKSPLQARPLDSGNSTPAHAYLPIPPSGARLKQDPEPDLREIEANVKEYETLIGSRLDKAARRIMKQYSSLSAECADLGGQFNAFSLESAPSIAAAVEKVGQAVDTGYISTETLMESLFVDFSEPLAESVQQAATARQVLKYRRYRALQVEMISDALASRTAALAELEKEETEAQRINSILHADERITAALSGTSGGTETHDDIGASETVSVSSHDGNELNGQGDTPAAPAPAPVPDSASGTSPSTDQVKSKLSAFRLPVFSQLNHALHGMMDVDPEASRRNSISRTRVQISNLGAALEVAREDADSATQAVRQELERYNKGKEVDLKKMVEVFIHCHIEWAEKNLQSWQEARQAISSAD